MALTSLLSVFLPVLYQRRVKLFVHEPVITCCIPPEQQDFALGQALSAAKDLSARGPWLRSG